MYRAVRVALAIDTRVVVSTDAVGGPTFLVESDQGPEGRGALMLPRPSALAQDDTPMIDVVRHAMQEIPCQPDDIWLLVQPTQPLRQPKHLIAAIQLLQNMEFDSVVSLTPIPRAHAPNFVVMYSDTTLTCGPWHGGWTDRPTRRQAVPWPYVCDGTVYAFYRRTVERYGDLFGELVGATIIDPSETCALDTPEDWAEAERRLSIESPITR